MVDELVERLEAVIDFFRSVNKPEELWGKPGGQQLQIWRFPDRERDLEAIAAALVARNVLLSQQVTTRRLTYEGVVPSIHKAFAEERLKSREVAERIIRELISFEARATIELPVLYVVAEEPITVGQVTFEALDIAGFRASPAGAWSYQIYDGRLTARARVAVRGDSWKQLMNALQSTEDALRVLSGAVFPWQIKQAAVPAVAGGGPQPGATPFRQVRGYGDPDWGGSFGAMHGPGGMLRPYAVIDELWGSQASAVAELLSSDGNNLSSTKRRILAAFRWLGEACRAHDSGGRFVAAVTALEALLSQRNDELRTAAGVTAMLAERAAFLSSSPDSRLATHRSVGRFYSLRSHIVHGRHVELDEGQVGEAGALAWAVAKALLELADELASDEDVAQWVLTRRYE